MTQILFTIEHCNYSCLMRKNQHFKLPYGKINILKSFFVNEIYLIFSENRKIAYFSNFGPFSENFETFFFLNMTKRNY